LKLAEKYGDRPAAELPLLFQRIVQNMIRDFYRRQKVRSAWTVLTSVLLGDRKIDDADPLEKLDVHADRDNPPDQLAGKQAIELIEKELRSLPPRQRQAFLLRYWEELDVAETAAVM